MADDISLKQGLDELSAKLAGRDATAAATPCEFWQSIRPRVVWLIGELNTLGAIFPKAKIAAEMLDAMRALCDALCHVSPAAVAPAADPLAGELARALNPKAAPADPHEPPCTVWRRVRPVVLSAVAELRALAKLIPALGQVADILAEIAQLLDALCGAAASPPATTQLRSIASKSYVAHPTRLARSALTAPARTHISYPAPAGLRPRTGGPFKVAALCRAYRFPTGLIGGGRIGILELGGGYLQSDLNKFADQNGLPHFTVNDVSLGGSNAPGGEADGEVLLDIQVAVAAYFYCTGTLPEVNVYFAPNAGQSFIDGMAAAARDRCATLSISWGGDESGWSQDEAQQVDNAAAAATDAGCTIWTSPQKVGAG